MIVEYAEVLADLDKEHDLIIQRDHEAVEAWIKAVTGHNWEDTDYVEFVDGTGTGSIFLDHYPIDDITEIALITSGIKIKNTSTDSRNAYVSIDGDSLDLAVIGGANAMTATLTFADNATLSAMVTAINDEAKGWDAVIYDTDFNSYPSSCLMEIKNHFCGSSRGDAPTYSYLEILDTPYDDYMCYADRGEVYRPGGWGKGRRNIVVKYSAYGTAQKDIQKAVRQAVSFLVTQREKGTEGIASYTTGDLTEKFESIMPGYVLDIVRLHSKVM